MFVSLDANDVVTAVAAVTIVIVVTAVAAVPGRARRPTNLARG